MSIRLPWDIPLSINDIDEMRKTGEPSSTNNNNINRGEAGDAALGVVGRIVPITNIDNNPSNIIIIDDIPNAPRNQIVSTLFIEGKTLSTDLDPSLIHSANNDAPTAPQLCAEHTDINLDEAIREGEDRIGKWLDHQIIKNIQDELITANPTNWNITIEPTLLSDDLSDAIEPLYNWLSSLDDVIEALSGCSISLMSKTNRKAIDYQITQLREIRKLCKENYSYRIQRVIEIVNSLVTEDGIEKIIEGEEDD